MQSLSNIINALARLGHEPGDSHYMNELWRSEPGDAFITKLVEVTRPQLPSFTVQVYLVAFCCECIHRYLTFQIAPYTTYQGLATLVNGLVTLGRPPNAEMCWAIESVAGPLLSTSTAQGIATLLHALTTSLSRDMRRPQHPSPAFLSAALAALSTEPRLSQVTSTTLSSTLASLPPGYSPSEEDSPGLMRLLAYTEKNLVPRLKLPHDCALLVQVRRP